MRRLGRAIRRTPLLADLPREVAVLATIAFFVALGFGILIPSLPIFASTFGVNAFQAGLVISAFALAAGEADGAAGLAARRSWCRLRDVPDAADYRVDPCTNQLSRRFTG